jgi:hypothetical protein
LRLMRRAADEALRLAAFNRRAEKRRNMIFG